MYVMNNLSHILFELIDLLAGRYSPLVDVGFVDGLVMTSYTGKYEELYPGRASAISSAACS